MNDTQNISVIVPTFNERDNVAELVRRLGDALTGRNAEIIFVDDSNDDTPAAIGRAALTSTVPVRLIHRLPGHREGGLGGAVLTGLRDSTADWCVVMDGDLQHPPELVPALVDRGIAETADVVVASRYIDGGGAGGLSGKVRHLVSKGSTILTRAMFPRRLRDCTDPMTGFFALNPRSVNLDKLHPRGFKILLEILARQDFRVREEPFVFGERFAGDSKASMRQGLHFLHQLASLRFGRMSRFAIVGGIGTVLNLAIMAVLLATGVHYLPAAIVATEVTILTNFLLTERFVFRDLRQGRPYWQRLLAFLGFNNIETLVRIPILMLLVEVLLIPGLLAQAITLAVAFLVRFTFTSRVIYRVRPTATSPISVAIPEEERLS